MIKINDIRKVVDCYLPPSILIAIGRVKHAFLYLYRVCIRDSYLSIRRVVKETQAQNRQDFLDRSSIKKYRSDFLLVRILGNDHYPRHSKDQTINNLKFILQNEPDFDGCRKCFVLNRIIDSEKEHQIVELLEQHSIDYIKIPFIANEYANTDWRINELGGIDFFLSSRFMKETERNKNLLRVWAVAPKICYAMNVNGARNAALKEGIESAIWTLVLDGNCIFTKENFESLKLEAESSPYHPYLIIPFVRMQDNNEYCLPKKKYNYKQEEPQIAFHASAKERFNESLPYGIMDKAALFKKLGLPGPWGHWGRLYWLKPHCPSQSPDRYAYKILQSQVFRLSSGGHGLEKKGARIDRYTSRMHSILRTIQYLNDECGSKDIEFGKYIFPSSK